MASISDSAEQGRVPLARPSREVCRAILCSFASLADSMYVRPDLTVVSPEMFRAIADLLGYKIPDGAEKGACVIDRMVARYWGLPPLFIDEVAQYHLKLR